MALDQHGTLLKMVVMVSQHHFTGRPCWSWLSWFICLSSRLWADPPRAGAGWADGHGPHGAGGGGARPSAPGDAPARRAADGGLRPPQPTVSARRRVSGARWATRDRGGGRGL